MALDPAHLPDDIATLKAMLLSRDAEIENLKLTIAKMQRDRFGAKSERGLKLLDQLELQLAELEEGVAQDRVAGELVMAPGDTETERQKPARRPLPAHLPRERVVHQGPHDCPSCGGRLAKLGEDITETLEHVPATWKVIQHVREKFTCRSCETICQAPAPNHPIARGRAGPHLLAQVLFNKYRAHLPLNRQSALFASDGIDLDTSTLADWVGATTATLMPLVEAIEAHVLGAQRLHIDDTTVPVLAKTKCRTGRLWTYVRDDAPFAGTAAPAALFHYSANRSAEHPERHLVDYSGICQADSYSGYNGLYVQGRKPGPITEASCWAHGRRKFFEIAELNRAPIAIEAVRRIDELFAIERRINGKPPDERVAVRQTQAKPLVEDLEAWFRAERRKLSSKNRIAKAIDYHLKQ
jgi:transposase